MLVSHFMKTSDTPAQTTRTVVPGFPSASPGKRMDEIFKQGYHQLITSTHTLITDLSSVISQKNGILKTCNILRCVGKNYFYKFRTDRSKVINK